MRSALLIMFTCLFLACTQNQGNKIPPNVEKFFDTESFVQAYFKKHLTQAQIEQTTRYQGQKETITKDSAELSTLKSLLTKSSINKPRLYDKYSVEKLDNQVSYRALDSSLLVRTLSIFNREGTVKNVVIEQSFKNINSQSTRNFTMTDDGIITMEKIVDEKDSLFITWNIR